MPSRTVTALVSGTVAAVLPPALVGASIVIADHSGCDPNGFACLGPFLLSLVGGLVVGWVLWGLLLHRLGQRLPWLVPLAAAGTVYATERLAGAALAWLPGGGRFGATWPLLVLAGAAWSWVLGQRDPATQPSA